MRRAWVGTALLAGSWLFGLDYLEPARPLAWFVLLTVATYLLGHVPLRWPDRSATALSLALLAPAVWLIPLPHKAIPTLLAIGIGMHLLPTPRRWLRVWSNGAGVAGLILLIQSLTLWGYASWTARHRELPDPMAKLVGVIPSLLGVDTSVDSGTIAMRSMQETQRVSATWELLLDPATLCFCAGGFVLLGLVSAGAATPLSRWPPFLRRSCVMMACVAVWTPIRIAFLISLVLHRTLSTDAVAAPNVGSVLVSAWLSVLLLAGPLLLLIRFLNHPALSGSSDESLRNDAPPALDRRRQWTAVVLSALGVALLVGSVFWVPVGGRKAGRVLVVERHSTWEPTTEPYGTTVYGEAGSYNYAAAYAYCGQYFEMSRLLDSDPIDDATLRHCDVLIVKTPTERYADDEVNAVVRYVERGGALLIGDHTNVFNMNTYLNDIVRPFGVTFRNDLLFRVGDPYKQPYRPPSIPHPAVQYVTPMHFAVSCSIDPGLSTGRAVIRNSGLWSLPPAYHESNYHPQAEYRPRMQYGAWCQLWSTTYGRGRVLVFADSTLFSNFCTFQPGKAELLRGMVQWLNHSSVLDMRPFRMLLGTIGVLGSLLLLVCVWRQQNRTHSLVLVAAGLAGWATAAGAVNAVHHHTLPVPPSERPLTHVVIDRTVSEVPLFTGAFTDGEEGVGYGMLEQWIPRLGNMISRSRGDDVCPGDALVIICPTRSIQPAYRQRLKEFVQSGGKLLVVDSADVGNSTANSLLCDFALGSQHSTSQVPSGALHCGFPAPEVPLEDVCQITGGDPIAWVGETPVAARTVHGLGSVTAIGFGNLFNDASMGFHWLPEPELEVRQRYEVLYGLLRAAEIGSF